MVGDFNKTHLSKITLFGKTLYQIKVEPTFCNILLNNKNNKNNNKIFDQIFDSDLYPLDD
jgi:hypothetical protein